MRQVRRTGSIRWIRVDKFPVAGLAAKRDVSVLSRPQIRTVHNVMGKIQIGQEVPVVDGVNIAAVGSANPVIRQSDAGIILEVTPRIVPMVPLWWM